MNIENILSLSESKTIEFKENSLAVKNILRTIISFSNTAGGILIIGVRDNDKSIAGIEDPLKEVEKMANIIDQIRFKHRNRTLDSHQRPYKTTLERENYLKMLGQSIKHP